MKKYYLVVEINLYTDKVKHLLLFHKATDAKSAVEDRLSSIIGEVDEFRFTYEIKKVYGN